MQTGREHANCEILLTSRHPNDGCCPTQVPQKALHLLERLRPIHEPSAALPPLPATCDSSLRTARTSVRPRRSATGCQPGGDGLQEVAWFRKCCCGSPRPRWWTAVTF